MNSMDEATYRRQMASAGIDVGVFRPVPLPEKHRPPIEREPEP
jgi:hypothetical protein